MASAGTGKTRALVNRVLYLLSTGQKGILCLTFTNSAANEMFERISKILRHWVLLSEYELECELKELVGDDEYSTNYARSLFHKLQKLLTIKTIHSFCYKLLTDFPKEAGISYNTKILEYREGLYYQAIDYFLHTTDDLGELAINLNKKKIFRIFEELERVIDHYQLYSDHLQKLKNSLALPEKQDNSHIVDILMQGSTRDIKHADLLKDKEEKVFLDIHGNKKKLSSIATKNLLQKFSELESFIIKAQEYCHLRYNIQSKITVIEKTELILNLAFQISNIFNTLKREYITYDEIIKLASKLLKDTKHQDWVKLSISKNVQHILIDEAQDNSREQWDIISLLSEDFFSGIGVENTQRTVFAVGDVKQSIYSFQGASAELFIKMQTYFTNIAAFFDQQLISRSLNTSYRSTSEILTLVDKVFNQEDILKRLSFYDKKIEHVCHRKDEIGHIEIWPLIKKENDNNEKLLLAQKIANEISLLLANNVAPIHNRITENDIMILVRHRDIFIHYLITELHKKNLNVVGYDRFIITNHILIKDLISLGKILLVPENDFELVKVLKSSIFNFSETDIFNLCNNRGENPVWNELNNQNPEIVNKIMSWSSMKGNTFKLYYTIIHERYLAKKEYENIIEKFLELASEQRILSDFLEFIESNKIEVKNNQSDGIHIMTVHGAKGLESKIVFLTDTTEIPQNRNYFIFNDDDVPLYIEDNSFDNVREKTNQKIYCEYIRLLYVAITRAKDRLYITGSGKNKPGCWYEIISSVAFK